MKQTSFSPTKKFYNSKINFIFGVIAIIQLPEIQQIFDGSQLLTGIASILGIIARTFYTDSKITK